MKVIKSKGGYFYKVYKNGNKKRISKQEYLKYKKLKSKIQKGGNQVIGYDFDGVIHTYVNTADSSGQVHPKSFDHNELIQLNAVNVEVLTQINKHKTNGNTVYIISSNPLTDIERFMNYYGVQVDGIHTCYNKTTHMFVQHKYNFINELKITTFYDDSQNHIDEIKVNSLQCDAILYVTPPYSFQIERTAYTNYKGNCFHNGCNNYLETRFLRQGREQCRMCGFPFCKKENHLTDFVSPDIINRSLEQLKGITESNITKTAITKTSNKNSNLLKVCNKCLQRCLPLVEEEKKVNSVYLVHVADKGPYENNVLIPKIRKSNLNLNSNLKSRIKNKSNKTIMSQLHPNLEQLPVPLQEKLRNKLYNKKFIKLSLIEDYKFAMYFSVVLIENEDNMENVMSAFSYRGDGKEQAIYIIKAYDLLNYLLSNVNNRYLNHNYLHFTPYWDHGKINQTHSIIYNKSSNKLTFLKSIFNTIKTNIKLVIAMFPDLESYYFDTQYLLTPEIFNTNHISDEIRFYKINEFVVTDIIDLNSLKHNGVKFFAYKTKGVNNSFSFEEISV